MRHRGILLLVVIILPLLAGCGEGGAGYQTSQAHVSMPVAAASASSTGFLDLASCSLIAGWAWDPTQPDAAINVDIYDGNTKLTTVTANTFRADLLAAGIGNGYHAYNYSPNFSDGLAHTITVLISGTGINLFNSPQTTPACTNLYAGYLDSASCSTIAGWAWASNEPDTAINVDIYDGSTKLATVAANTFRADLLAAGIGNGYHAYNYSPNFSDGLAHTIAVQISGTSINLVNSPQTTAACTNAYGGYLDIASCSLIAGWAWAANEPDTAINVDIYDGSTKLTTVTANMFRADLLAAGIGNGYHGYSYTPNFSNGGTHTITADIGGTLISLSNSPQTTAACGTTTTTTTSVTTTIFSTSSVTTTMVTTTSASTTSIGSGTSNVLSLTANGQQCDSSINGGYLNDPCVSVTVCTPGTSTCQTINGILLDTGSYGLRIFKQKLGNVSPAQVASGQGSLAECAQFADGSSLWGPVQTAIVILGSEPAVQMPIQVIDYTFGTVPRSCGTPSGTPSEAGFNGILGVGPLANDCGQTCVNGAIGLYYSCSGASCSGTTVPLSNQLPNPVASLPSDNNGLIVQLPAISAGGAPSVSGSIILGIGTQSNNSPSGVTAYPLDNLGDFLTSFANVTYSSFIDTGSNGLFFPSSGLLPTCTSGNGNGVWFCPSSTTAFSAAIEGASGSPVATVPFQIGNFNNLTNSSNNVFNDIGANNSGAFDWGLPFYFGRNVFIGISGKTSGLGMGPYFAF